VALRMLPSSAHITRGVRCDLTAPVVHAEGRRTVIDLWGEWDLSSRQVLSEALSRVIALPSGDVVIDLAEAKFIDTVTVRVFAASQQMLDRHGRKLTFRSPSRLAARVLDVFGLSDLIEP
jgi:anti-anti-sigma factor